MEGLRPRIGRFSNLTCLPPPGHRELRPAKAKAQAEAKKETFAQGVQEDKKELEALMQEVVQKRIDSGI